MIKPFTYQGGKSNLISYLLPLIPTHEIYCEPFFGSGALYFSKPPSPKEVINDIDFRVVAFFRVLRDRHLFPEFYRMCEFTPYSRAECACAIAEMEQQIQKIGSIEKKEINNLTEDELLKLAWSFFVCVRQCFAGTGIRKKTSWGFTLVCDERDSIHQWLTAIGYLPEIHKRLQKTYIECDDAINVIRRWDTADTFFFIDPPYLVTRQKEIYPAATNEQYHIKMLETILQCKGKFLITHPNHPIYTDFLRNWRRKDINTTIQVIKRNRKGIGTYQKEERNALKAETLWWNYFLQSNILTL